MTRLGLRGLGLRTPGLQRPLGRAAIAVALLAASCSPPTEFEHRVRPDQGEAEAFDKGTRERLLGRKEQEAVDGNVAAPPGPAAGGLVYAVPEGWQELPPTPFRNANLLVPGDAPAECTLSLLPGEAGGLVGNVNRWLVQQMGQEPLTPQAVDALPRRAFFGGEATLVDVTGSFAGMAGGPRPGFRMVGLLLCEPAGSRFLKFVGPEATVAGALPEFFSLADSMRLTEAPAPPPEPPAEGEGLGFIAPDGWERAGDRPMRVVNFEIAHADRGAPTEAYVTVLGRDGGGVLANFQRWRSQMGQPALTDAEFADLERLPMLGVEATLIQVRGPFAGMAGEALEDAMLLGAIALLEDRAVFVKLIGPAETAETQLDSFRAFCSSLRL